MVVDHPDRDAGNEQAAPRPSASWLTTTLSVVSRTTTSTAATTPTTSQTVRKRVLMMSSFFEVWNMSLSRRVRTEGGAGPPPPSAIGVSPRLRRRIDRRGCAVGDRDLTVLVLLDAHLDPTDGEEHGVLAAGHWAHDAPLRPVKARRPRRMASGVTLSAPISFMNFVRVMALPYVGRRSPLASHFSIPLASA